MLELLSQDGNLGQSIWVNPYVTGLFGAALAAIGAYIIEFWKVRRASRPGLSWRFELDAPQRFETHGSSERMKISYGDHIAENLNIIRYRVSNSGNIDIRDEILWFSFPRGAVLLEEFLDPDIKPGFDVSRIEDSAATVAMRIGYLPPGASVFFNFICDGGSWDGWGDIDNRNEHVYVPFQPDGTARAIDDKEHLRKFFVPSFGWIIFQSVAVILGLLGQYLAALTATMMALFFAAIAVLYITGASRAVVSSLTEKDGSGNTAVHVHGDGARVWLNNSYSE